MKKQILIILLLMLATNVFSQPTTNPAIKTNYLKKSSNQKFLAWTFFGVGTVVLTITALSNFGFDYTAPKKSFPVVTVGMGVICMAGSIPLFIACSRNKKKGMSLSFKNKTVPLLQKSSFVYKSIPSLTLSISL